MRRSEVLLLSVLFTAAIIFVGIGIHRPLWLDEANTVLTARHSLTGIVSQLCNENNFPFFYILLSAWIRLFGISEVSLRLLVGTFYVAGGVIAYFLGREVFRDTRVGLYSSFCYLISGQAIRQAQNVRMYSLLGLLAATSALLFLRLAKNPTKLDWSLYILVTALGTFTHAWFFFLLFAQVICLLAFPVSTRLKVVAALFVGVVPFIILWLPSFLAQVNNGATSWMPKFRLSFAWEAFAQFYRSEMFFAHGSMAINLAVVFFAACGALILPSALTRAASANAGPAVFLVACLAVIPVGAALVVTLFHPIYWPDRYTIVALPSLALLLGWALAEFSPRVPLIWFSYAMVLLVTLAHFQSRAKVPEFLELPPGYSDSRTTNYLLSHARSGDPLVFVSLSRAAIDYYLLRNNAANRFREMNFPPGIANHLAWQDPQSDLKHPHQLASEAADLNSELETALVDPQARVWLFEGAVSEYDEALRNGLDDHFELEKVLDLRGSYYFRVSVLKKR